MGGDLSFSRPGPEPEPAPFLVPVPLIDIEKHRIGSQQPLLQQCNSILCMKATGDTVHDCTLPVRRVVSVDVTATFSFSSFPAPATRPYSLDIEYVARPELSIGGYHTLSLYFFQVLYSLIPSSALSSLRTLVKPLQRPSASLLSMEPEPSLLTRCSVSPAILPL